MNNNKGQTLALFIIIFPILLLTLVLMIDIGKVYTKKIELDNINKIALNYGLNNFNLNDSDLESKILNIIKLNNEKIDNIEIKIDNEKIYINITENINGIFTKMINVQVFKIKSTYIGYIKENTKRIERV